MVPQLQFDGVGVKIVLAFQVWLVILADVVFEQGKGHNERKMSFMVMIYYFKDLLLFI